MTAFIYIQLCPKYLGGTMYKRCFMYKNSLHLNLTMCTLTTVTACSHWYMICCYDYLSIWLCCSFTVNVRLLVLFAQLLLFGLKSLWKTLSMHEANRSWRRGIGVLLQKRWPLVRGEGKRTSPCAAGHTARETRDVYPPRWEAFGWNEPCVYAGVSGRAVNAVLLAPGSEPATALALTRSAMLDAVFGKQDIWLRRRLAKLVSRHGANSRREALVLGIAVA